ncbi:MAG: RdgB/HAM1 family non-canonical purine NTP pyrophosphatase [Anaerolineae bacterium]|nr:RdgB/HAM1 family non-canonical purine NTP pyrophosphatase [Anaerolineae bacterium]MDK1119226.1 RdgB/HAM1 family non-canonical purine NTP pyrophosphatase [Anaerolineae bacterium]
MKNNPQLIIATNNKGKVEEIQSLLQGLDIALLVPADLGLNIEVIENGTTYAENAMKKAQTLSQASGLTSLADDSGLEVDALNGKPGLQSNRFGPEPYTDTSRRAYLLHKLADSPRPWAARFRATVAIASPERAGITFEGVCPGEIIPDERGENGFGYDPIFQLDGTDHTMAELGLIEKNRFSHRGKAIRKAIPILIEIFGNNLIMDLVQESS